MTSDQISEARREVSAAATFDRKPKQWAVDALEAAKASRKMTYAEALDVQRAAIFGRSTDAGALAEARSVLEEAAPHLRAFDELETQVARFAESRLGMTPRNAALHAQSEAIACRQGDWSAAESVKKLRARCDALAAMVKS